MEIPQHQYNLKFKQTEEILRRLSDENRVRKYLEALDAYNPEILGHSFRVSLLCVDLGFESGFQEKEIKLLGYGGLLHDVGKIQIPSEILDKNTSLTSSEREIMQEHARLGAKAVNEFGPDLRSLIVAHQEYKVNAYPRTGSDRRSCERSGEKDRRVVNPLVKELTQILVISDLYDALRSERSYKPAKDKVETKRIMLSQYTGNPKYIDQLLTR